MASLSRQFLLLLVSIILVAMVAMTNAMQTQKSSSKLSAPALIVFGDSTVDAGNNNHISTSLKSDFPPYGRDFLSHKPTGRFTNGRLVTDFLAEGLGIKNTVPPYLDPFLSEKDLMSGVSFASAGTGYDNNTARVFSVIPMWKQVEYFKDYVAKLKRIAGAEKAQSLIEKAVIVVSIGSNDFLENYYVNPYSRVVYSNVSDFQDHLLKISYDSLEKVYNYGARRIALAGIPPLGCLPIEKTLNIRISFFNRMPKSNKTCVDALNQHAISYNAKLQHMIQVMRAKFPDLKIEYADVFSRLMDMERNPSKYGFKETRRACCGTGFVEFGYGCNRRNPFTCLDASLYIFWDAFHPTEKVYQIVANDLLKNCISKLL